MMDNSMSLLLELRAAKRLIKELRDENERLRVDRAFYDVAIKERDYERQRNKPIRLFGPEGEMEEL